MSTQKKGGKKPKAADKKQEAPQAEGDIFMNALKPQRRNKMKKLDKIKETLAKGGDLNDSQKNMVSQQEDLQQQLDKLDYYIGLYEKSNPDWNKAEEEVKVEEVKQEEPKVDLCVVEKAFTMFAQMMTLQSRLIAGHVEISKEEKAALDKTMGMSIDQVTCCEEELLSDNHEHQTSFAKAMVGALSCDVLTSMCTRVFSSDELSKARQHCADSKVEPVVQQEPEPEEEQHVENQPDPSEEVVHEDENTVVVNEEPVAQPDEEEKVHTEDQPVEESKPAAQDEVPKEKMKREFPQRQRQDRGDRGERRGGDDRRGGRGERGNYRGDRGGRGDRGRGGRGGRGNNKWSNQDEDGFELAADRMQKPRGGYRGDRGGRGGDNPRPQRTYNKEFSGEMQRGGGRGGRGRANERPATATGEDNNKEKIGGNDE